MDQADKRWASTQLGVYVWGVRKAVFIVQICQVASTGSKGSDWNDSAGTTG